MKIKLIFFLLFFESIFFRCFAQTFFNKRIDGHNWTYPGTSIIRIDDGSLMIASQYAVVKTDSLGEFVWARDYDVSISYRKLIKGENNYIYVGSTSNDGVLLSKIDTAGNLYWTKAYNLGSSALPDLFYDMIMNNDASIIMVGSIMNWSINLDSVQGYFLMVDTNGNVMHSKTYIDPLSKNSWVYSINRKGSSHYLLSGSNGIDTSSMQDGLIIEVDSVGNLVSEYSIGTNSNEDIRSVFSDNGDFVFTLINRGINLTNDLPILVCLDSAYSLKWEKLYDYSCNGFIFHPLLVGRINHNYLYNSGQQVGELDSMGTLLTRNGISSAFPFTYEFLAYCKAGNNIFYTGGEGVTYDYLLIAKSDSTGYSGCGYVNVAPPCISSVNISVQPLTLFADSLFVDIASSNNSYSRPTPNVYINCLSTGVNEINSNSIKVYPNPAYDLINVSFDFYSDQLSLDLKIIDNYGQIVYSTFINTSTKCIQLNNLVNGMYNFSFQTKDYIFNKKIIINR